MASPLAALARDAPLSPPEFATLVDLQFRALLDRFPRTQFPELRSLPCLWDGPGGHVDGRSLLRDGPPTDAPQGLSLTTRGLFFKQPPDQVSYHGEPRDPSYHVSRDGTVVLYGLTDQGRWMLAHVHFGYHPGPKDRGWHEAKQAILRFSDPATIADTAKVPISRVIGQAWQTVARLTKTAAEQALAQAQTEVTDLDGRLHDLHLAAAWMSVHHSDDVR